MLVAYLADSQLLRALAALMGLPATCTCTALTYLHRVRNTHHVSPNLPSQVGMGLATVSAVAVAFAEIRYTVAALTSW